MEIVETEISEIEQDKGRIKNVVFADGNMIPFEAVYSAIPFTHHSDIPASLGCALTGQGYIKVDDFQKTTIEGVFACGDNTAMLRSVANAVHSGNFA